MTRAERGVALLEVIVALAIASIAGSAMAAAVSDLIHAERAAALAEQALLGEDQMLTGLALLSRTELERWLGETSAGGYLVRVQRTRQSLFRIGVRTPGTPVTEELVAVVRRPAELVP